MRYFLFLISFNGWGVSLIDGLDTMWIMGLHDEFIDSMPLVANMTFALDQVRSPFHLSHELTH
jgi:mannosyl-oligosaccharide alpha-1,2-mannosidase